MLKFVGNAAGYGLPRNLRHSVSAAVSRRVGNERVVRTSGLVWSVPLAGLVAVVGVAWLLAFPRPAPGAETQRAWGLQIVPNPAGARSSALLDVSCVTTDWCIAVGDYADRTGHSLALVERWNGHSWTIMSTPNPPGTTSSTLLAVSCSSTNACVALGSYRDRHGTTFALATRLSGGSWIAQQPALASQAQLLDVSCPTDRICIAVGTTQPKYSLDHGGGRAAIAERWTPTGWAVLPTPTTGPASHSYLAAVSCTSATSCMAVGSSDGGANPNCPYPELAITDHWNGHTWNHPLGWDPCFGALSDVSCIPASGCMVVGGSDLPASSLPIVSLIGAKHGGNFNIANDNTNQAINENHWWRVSCASTTTCLAIVGPNATLVGLTNRVWSIEPQYPTEMTPINIACATTKTCIVIGRYHHQAASITPTLQPGPIKLFQTRPTRNQQNP